MPSLRKFRQKWFGLRIFHSFFLCIFMMKIKQKIKVEAFLHFATSSRHERFWHIYIFFLNASMGFLVNNKNDFRGNFSDLAKIFAKFACLRSRWPLGNCQHSRGLRGHDNDYAENYGQFWRLLYYFKGRIRRNKVLRCFYIPNSIAPVNK